MENAKLIVEPGVFVATVIAAFIAWRSVVDARAARDDAQTYEADALKHQDAALESSKAAVIAAENAASAADRSAFEHRRAADALERQVLLAEAALAGPSPSWEVARETGPTWSVTNRTGFTVRDPFLQSTPGYLIDQRPHSGSLPPNGRLIFDVVDPGARSIPLSVNWLEHVDGKLVKWVTEVSVM